MVMLLQATLNILCRHSSNSQELSSHKCLCCCLQAASKDALRAVAAIDGKPRSLLLFQGAGDVQGLFDYLLADVVEGSSAHVDVPLLMAPVPFPSAGLHQLQTQVAETPPLDIQHWGRRCCCVDLL